MISENSVEEAVEELAHGDPKLAAEALRDLADAFAKMGAPISAFFDLRKHIIQSAIAKTNNLFIEEKLKIIERDMQRERIRVTTH